jgi:hypothetical protein
LWTAKPISETNNNKAHISQQEQPHACPSSETKRREPFIPFILHASISSSSESDIAASLSVRLDFGGACAGARRGVVLGRFPMLG